MLASAACVSKGFRSARPMVAQLPGAERTEAGAAVLRGLRVELGACVLETRFGAAAGAATSASPTRGVAVRWNESFAPKLCYDLGE